MARLLRKALATKSDDLSSVPGTYRWKERTNSYKWSSDFLKCATGGCSGISPHFASWTEQGCGTCHILNCILHLYFALALYP